MSAVTLGGEAGAASAARQSSGYSLQEVAQRWRRLRERVRARPLPSDSARRKQAIVVLLSEALALTSLSACRYRRHSLADPGLTSEYQQYAQDAQCVAEEISAHIRALHREPVFEPIRLSPGWATTAEQETLLDMVLEDLIAARIALRSCREAVAHLQTQDRRTRTLFEAILAIQQEQVAGLARRHELLRGRDH